MMLKNYFNIFYVLLFLIFTSCKSYQIIETTHLKIPIKNTKFDSTIYNQYKIYKDSLDKTMFENIAYIEDDLYKKQPNSSLGNFVADLLLETTKHYTKDTTIDFAMMNIGGIRVPSLSKGNININDIYNIMPFDNYIGYQTISGKEIKGIFDSICKKGGWPISNATCTCIQNESKNIIINNSSLDLSNYYKMAVIDYIANGGDGMSNLKLITYQNTGILFRDAIINHLKLKKTTIKPNYENRIVYE